MKISLRSKLTLSYFLIIVTCILLILLLIHSAVNQVFRNYVTENQNKVFNQTANLVINSFGEDGSSPDIDVIRNIGESALNQGMILEVITNDNSINWCMHCEYEDRCSNMLSMVKQNTSNQNGKLSQKEYEIIKNGKTYGKVILQYYGPYYYSNSDAAFLSAFNKIILYIIPASILIAVLFGVFMAGRISKPIRHIVKKTEDIGKGKFEAITVKSSTLEVDELIGSINRLAQTLDRQKKLRMRLATDYAHELRTPLAVLKTNIEAMIDGIWEASPDRLLSCNEEILRLTRMLEDIDKLAEAEDENLSLNKTRFSLLELSKEKAKTFEIIMNEKNQKLTVSGENAIIFADRDKIGQLIVNLLSNAVKYTGENSKIDLNIKKEKDYCILSVKDNGIGIEKDKLPLIFDHLYRADPSRNRKVPGSGIGLSIVKAISEAHGGFAKAESKLGEGSVFEVILPLEKTN